MRGLVLALALWVAVPCGATAGSLEGRVRVAIDGLALADVTPLVVYLEAPAGRTVPVPDDVPLVRQRSARFAPVFLAIAAGQSVEMANDDWIYHSVFSYSAPNDFDLGLYPAGESQTVLLAHPGVVKTYCSIHESMNGTIFISPSPWFDPVAQDGSYRIEGVPPGHYRLRTWSERLPALERDVEVDDGQPAVVELVIDLADPG